MPMAFFYVVILRAMLFLVPYIDILLQVTRDYYSIVMAVSHPAV